MSTNQKGIIFASFIIVICLLLQTSYANALDNPHNINNSINCGHCHSQIPPAWLSETADPANPEPANSEPENAWLYRLCLKCHNGTDATYKKTHSNFVINGVESWALVCTDCHEVHTQRQNRVYKTESYLNNLTDKSTAVTASSLTKTGAGWTPDQWKDRILIPNVVYPSFNYKILSNTADTITIDTGGGDAINLSYIKPGQTFGIVYGKLVKDVVNGMRVRFFRQTGTNSFADGDATIDGICEACHTQTAYHRNNASGDHTHNAAADCTVCHSHVDGFTDYGSMASVSNVDVRKLVSANSAGIQGNSSSYAPSISADGRYVAFASLANNLASGDTNGIWDVFVHDRVTGTTELVSKNSAGIQGNGWSNRPSISSDGRYVAFASYAGNLVSGDTNNGWDIFVHDRVTGTTERASVDSSGIQGNDWSKWPSISADGRYVAFESYASNLVSGDTNTGWDVFVHDRVTGTTERVSVGSHYPSISSDGRYVAFDTGWDVFVHDRAIGTTERVSVDSSGIQGDNWSKWPSISPDGRYVAFVSSAGNLIPGDTNRTYDVFVHDRVTKTTERASVDGSGNQGNNYSWLPSISDNGRVVAYASLSSNLVSGDSNEAYDVFVFDRSGDIMPPATVITLSGSSGDNGWYVSDVQITLIAVDSIDGSGVKEIHYILDGAETIISGSTAGFTISADGTHSLSIWAVDNANNLETAHPATINIDKTPPTITAITSPAANANEWNNTDVVVTFTCSDATSGIAVCPAPITVTTERLGQAISGSAVDNAGNSAITSVTLNVDKTPTVITITGVSNGASYALGLAPTASYTVTDALSGVATSNAGLTGGDSLGLGTFTYTVTALDNAGNTITSSVAYNVIATTDGLAALIQQMLASGQIDNPGIANSLISKIENASKAPNDNTLDNIMQAFINQVSAQSGQHISPDAAAILINAANYIITH